MALRGGDRDRQHHLDVRELVAGRAARQCSMSSTTSRDDQQLVVERQLVLGEVDHALDRVLDRDEAEFDLAAGDGIEHVGHGAVRDQLAPGEVGLRSERLLGERAERPEEPDPHRSAVGGSGPARVRSWPLRLRAGRRAACRCAMVSGTMAAMDEPTLRALIDGDPSGATSPDDAVATLRRLPFADVGDALVDHHRALRQGMPEASTGPASRPSSACGSSASCSTTAPARCCSPEPPTSRSKAVARRARRRRAARLAALLWRRPEPRTDDGCSSSPPAPPTPPSPTRPRHARRPRHRRRPPARRRRRRAAPAARPPRRVTSADASSSSPAWRARWPA